MQLRQDNSLQASPHQQVVLRLENNVEQIRMLFENFYEDNYEKLVPEIIDIYKDANENIDTPRLRKALKLSIKGHLGQGRDSQDQYISHPVAAGYIVAEQKESEDAIIAAGLHDIFEENESELEFYVDAIEKQFGTEVLTAVGALSIFDTSSARDAARLKNIYHQAKAAGTEYILSAYLGDGIHNLLTAHHMKAKNGMTAQERQKNYAKICKKNLLPTARLLDNLKEIDLNREQYIESLVNRYL